VLSGPLAASLSIPPGMRHVPLCLAYVSSVTTAFASELSQLPASLEDLGADRRLSLVVFFRSVSYVYL